MSNFKAVLAKASADVYNKPSFRTDIGEHRYYPSLSGPKTGVYSGPQQTIVAHRGMTFNIDDISIINIASI